MEGDPKFEASQQIPDVSYAGFAEMLGLRGIRIETPEQVAPAWDEAFASDRPAVVDARVDPEVPPIPPHVSRDQARAVFSSLVRGDPEARDMVRQMFREQVASRIPGRG